SPRHSHVGTEDAVKPPSTPSTPSHRVRCIFFDLGSTLWHRVDHAAWVAMELAANRRAVAVLRAAVPAEALPSLSGDAVGAALRAIIEAEIKRRHLSTPEEEPRFGAVAEHALHVVGIAAADLALGTAVFEALRVGSAASRILYPDALATLAELRARGYLLGV